MVLGLALLREMSDSPVKNSYGLLVKIKSILL